MKAVPFGNDGRFTPEDFVEKMNFDLANDLGNLLNRTVAMINKYRDGQIPALESNVTPFDKDLEETAATAIQEYCDDLDKTYFAKALESLWKLVSRTNKYIDETEPWKLAKDESAEANAQLDSVLAHLAASLRVIAILLQPVMTHAPQQIFEQLGLATDKMEIKDLSYFDLPAGATVVKKGTPIFPRLDKDEEIEYMQSMMTANEKAKGRKNMAVNTEDAFDPSKTTLNLTKKEIRFDKFEKIELKVCEIKAVEKVENADKLLKFRLDAGDEGDRQIISGIASWYPEPQKLVGKKVIAVTNLKPREMRGELSQGMLLSAEFGDQVQLLTVPENIPNGSIVG